MGRQDEYLELAREAAKRRAARERMERGRAADANGGGTDGAPGARRDEHNETVRRDERRMREQRHLENAREAAARRPLIAVPAFLEEEEPEDEDDMDFCL